MHEGKFTEQIVEVILRELAKYPGRKPKAVKVKVGEVFHLVPESVLMHYQMQVKGTALEGIELDLEEEPMEVVCSVCHTKGQLADHHLMVCPSCFSRNVKAVSGNTITVQSIELHV